MKEHQKDPMYPLFRWLVMDGWFLPPCFQLKRMKLADRILSGCIRRSQRSAQWNT